MPHKSIDLYCSPHPNRPHGLKRYWFSGLEGISHIFMLMGEPEGHGCLLWEDPQAWLEEYHIRSISETVKTIAKCRFGAPLKKKLDSRKATETRLKLVGYPKVMGDVVPH